MPIYNHTEEQLRAAIESILTQTYSDFEFIIVDGSIDDKNSEIISSIKDERIRYFRVIGYINCLNYGIQQAKGKYLARMDSDDISLPTRLEEQVKFLNKNPEVSLCSCLAEYFGKLKKFRFSQHKKEINLINLIKKEEFVHTAMMFRKELNLQYEHIKPLEDCLLFRKLLLEGKKFEIIDKVLFKSYKSGHSLMARHPELMRRFRSKMNTYALTKYYNSHLSFEEEIFTKKKYSKAEIHEFLDFIKQNEQKIKTDGLKIHNLFAPYFYSMLSHCKGFNPLFSPECLQMFIIPDLVKKTTQKIFRIKNEYRNTRKSKIITVLGLTFRLKNINT